MRLDEKTVGVWVLQTTPTQDYMAMLREIVPEEKYELEYRFRYYTDEKIFDSDDKKSWWRGTVSGTRNDVLLGVREVLKQMERFAVGPTHELLNDGDLRAFAEKLGDLPGLHLRQLSGEEAKKHGL
jgi:hypothetical protein